MAIEWYQLEVVGVYFHGETVPLYLLTLYAKNERDTLTAQEINALEKFTTTLKATLQKKERQK